MSGDIFAGHGSDPDLLAEIYDLEHDAIVEDHAFFRHMARRHAGTVLDLGCGSGRLFDAFLAGGARRIVGVDASAALLKRARQRVRASDSLSALSGDGRLHLIEDDVRRLDRRRLARALGSSRAGLAVLAGVLPHVDGPEDAMALLTGVTSLLGRRGVLVIDDFGPAMLPAADLPLSLDWRRVVDGREIVRRSQLARREAPEGLRVLFSTIVDVGRPDGTIARLPASHRLWYPSEDALTALVREAGLTVELAYGSHDLDPFTRDSERRIFVIRADRGPTGTAPGGRRVRDDGDQRGS